MKDLINEYKDERICTYEDETYSVRDNGAVLRHPKAEGRKRVIDGIWTFGTVNKKMVIYLLLVLEFIELSQQLFMVKLQPKNTL